MSTNNSNTNGTPFNDVGKVSIGQEYDNSSETDHFQGSIPVVMVYDKVISQNERNELYNTYKKRYIDGISMKNISSSSSITVDEMSSVDSFIANLTATDSDTTSFTYSLVSGNGSNDQNNSLFTVSGTQL